MDINIHYQSSAHELAKASFLFIERKPLLRLSIGFFNALAGLLVFIFFLKLYFLGLTWKEWITLFGASIWLFGRKPLNQWLLLQRMKKNRALNKPFTVNVSRNGIAWSGQGVKPGNMAWEQVKYVWETQNGFILPNAFTKFLWLPFRGFASVEMIDEFKEYIKERKIKHRVFRWHC